MTRMKHLRLGRILSNQTTGVGIGIGNPSTTNTATIISTRSFYGRCWATTTTGRKDVSSLASIGNSDFYNINQQKHVPTTTTATGFRASFSSLATATTTNMRNTAGWWTQSKSKSTSSSSLSSHNNGTTTAYQKDVVVQKIQIRGLAIKRKKKQRGGGGGGGNDQRHDGNLPLMNEHLVKELMKRHSDVTTAPDKIQLRLVIEGSYNEETGEKEAPTSEETSLDRAIQTSLDLGVDLVAIDLDNPHLPVIRAVHYESKIYQNNKKLKAKQKDTKDLASIVKEFRFKARTADHDFDRKLSAVLDALRKGHKCQIQATCQVRLMKTGVCPDGAVEVMDRILAAIETEGDKMRPPDVNQEKTVASVQVMPKKKNSNKK